ncbi:MAG TPA: hypothetical protein VIS76_02095 [Pseudomonadales bacterium]
MSNVKDKLTASMRTVKAGGKPAAGKKTKAASGKPAAKSTAPRKSPKKAPASGKTTVPGDVHESGTELFPTRVWPD